MALASKKRGAAAKKGTKASAKAATKAPTKEKAPVETPPVETPPVETPPVETPPVETDQPKTKKPSETTEVTVKKTNVPAPPMGKLVLALDDCKDAIEPCEFGMLPRITASQGALVCDGEELGKQIEITVMSYNDSYAIAPNESDAPKELCKFSYDNVVLNDGSGILVADYLDRLRQEGYENAASKQYFEIIASLDDAEQDHDEIGSVVQLSLSPQSVKQFNRYKLNSAMAIRKGAFTEEDVKRVTVTAKTKTFSYTFTMMRFSVTED